MLWILLVVNFLFTFLILNAAIILGYLESIADICDLDLFNYHVECLKYESKKKSLKGLRAKIMVRFFEKGEK